jgi:hypothetical protein
MANARTQFDALASSLQQHDEATQGLLAGRACLSLEGEPFLVLYRENVAFRLAGSALTHALALAGATGFDPMKPDDRNPLAPGWGRVPVAHRSNWEHSAREAMRCAHLARSQNVSWQAPPPAPEPAAAAPPSSAQSLSDRAAAAMKSGFGFELKHDG